MRISDAINRVVADVQDNAVLVALVCALLLTVLCLSTFGLIIAAVWTRDWWRARHALDRGPAAEAAASPTAVPEPAAWPEPGPVDAAPFPARQGWLPAAPNALAGPARFPRRRIEAYMRLSQKTGDWPAWQFELDQFAVTTFEPDDDAAPD